MELSAVERVASVMQPVGIWWAVAGGWAIDLWLGEQTREHHDIEVAVRRVDQMSLWDSLHDEWELLSLEPPGSDWTRWDRKSEIAPPSFQLKVRASLFEFDIFLESTIDNIWCFRRDGRVQRPLDEITTTRLGIPIVTPAVQLLYMAKSEELKNQQDFEMVRPKLDDASSEWLRDMLVVVHPRHPWSDLL